MPRRKSAELIPIERRILEAAVRLALARRPGFYGYQIAKIVANGTGPSSLAGHGTIYKALGRLEEMGFLKSAWEDLLSAEDARRPRRRIYEITPAGATELAREPEAARRVTSSAVQHA